MFAGLSIIQSRQWRLDNCISIVPNLPSASYGAHVEHTGLSLRNMRCASHNVNRTNLPEYTLTLLIDTGLT